MALKEKRSEVMVGLFLLIGLSILCTLLIKFGNLGSSGKNETYEVFVVFNDASGLIKGSEVRMGGARIGKVSKIPELQEDLKVKVSLKLNERIKIDKASSFQVQSLTIIGDKMIVVGRPEETQKSGVVLQNGDIIQGGEAGGFDAIQSDAESVAKNAKKIMQDARQTLLKIDASIDDIRLVAGRLAETVDRVNTGLLDDQNLASFKGTMQNLESASKGFKAIEGEVTPLLKEARTTFTKVNSTINIANQTLTGISSKLDAIKPTLTKLPKVLASFKSAADKARSTMATAEGIMHKLAGGDGLLNTLASDKEVNTDTKQFIKNLKHYGILRYKDDETADPKDPQKNRYRSKRRN